MAETQPLKHDETVVDLSEFRRTTARHSPQNLVVIRGEIVTPDSSREGNSELTDLYTPDSPSGAMIYHARRLLSEAKIYLQNARTCLSENDIVGFDNEIRLLQADLPELFCCNDLSDGFGAVVLASYYGLRNRGGEALSYIQLGILEQVVDQLRATPFMGFDKGLDLIDKLVEAGFRTDPAEAGILSEAFNAQESVG